MSEANASVDDAPLDRAVRKAFSHVLPWCVAFYMAAYLDRINIGFAALTMNKDLGLTATMFGVAGTWFYAVYVGFETPSTLMLARFGARFWLPRIMVTWGLASMATVFATGPHSLYALRALVGVAEAGLTPGILLYLGYWFPKVHRAKANGLFLASLPLALMIAAPISGFVLQLDGWLGLAGWRWVFIFEGLPSVILGIAALFCLRNGPSDAKWLSPLESQALARRLDLERSALPDDVKTARHTVWGEITNPRLLFLSLTYFSIQATSNTLGLWTPQIIKEFLGSASLLHVSFVTAIPPAISIVAVLFVSAHSDRKRERNWHLVGTLVACVIGWALVALAPTVGKLVGLALCFSGNYSALSIFWASVTSLFSQRRQAVVIGLISTIGTTAAIISPYVVGFLRDLTHNFNASIWYVTVLLIAGIACFMTTARINLRAPEAQSPPVVH